MSWFGGVQIYKRNADYFQRPSVWINQSVMPTCAATDAAPILKLWPLKQVISRHVVLKACLTTATRSTCESGRPSAYTNRGPVTGGRMARYASTAETGQI